MPVKFSAAAPEAYHYPLLIKHLLSSLPQFAGQEIVSDGRRYSYADFGRRLHRLAHGLRSLGVGEGTVVAAMDWDSHRYLECYFAVPMMGAVLQTVNVRLAPEQIAFTLRQTGAEILLYHADFADLADAIAPGLPALRARIPMSAGDGRAGGGGAGYDSLLIDTPAAFDFPDFDENALATTFHTTGTTGDPKAVAFSHRQLVLHTLALGTALANQPDGQGFRRSDVYMPMTPMFHVHAWGVPYLATMLGAKQVYPGRYDPATLIDLKAREGVTFSHCVPTILRMIVDRLPVAAAGSPDRWTMVIGGGALSPALMTAARARGISAIGGYGMSETGPVVAIARAGGEEDAEARRRAGLPIPLVQARLPEEGIGQDGELLLRAPWLTQGYEGAPEASQALWSGGWLHTQDIARIDGDGGVEIVDRAKDVIKTGGEWISSATIEAFCLEHPAIREAAVIGIPDERWGERPVAVLVMEDGGAGGIARDDLRAHLAAYVEKGAISRYALPDAVLVLDVLPRTSVGKIDKKALRARLADGADQRLAD